MAKISREKKLTQRQELAVRELARGKGLAAAARAVGVTRTTLYRWQTEPGFVAAMNRWRAAVVTLTRGKILAGLDDAAATVVKAAREGNATIAMALLDKSGVFDPPSHAGTDPRQVAREQLLSDRAGRVGLENVERALVDTEKRNDLRRALDALPASSRPIPALSRSPKAQAAEGAALAKEHSGADPVIGSHESWPKLLSAPTDPAKPYPPAIHKRDPELEQAMADAEAFLAAETAKVAERRRTEEQPEQPPTPGQPDRLPSPPSAKSAIKMDDGTTPLNSSPTGPTYPAEPPLPDPKEVPRTANERSAGIANVPQRKIRMYDGLEPIDDLEDQFTEIVWLERPK